MSVRVLLIDDSKNVVRELRSLLSLNPGWLVCGEAINGVEAVEKARSLRPDLILMDISMPQMNGIEATRIIRRQVPESAVILSVRMIRYCLQASGGKWRERISRQGRSRS